MQRADLSLGIPTYMGMHIPLGAQEVPAELPRSSEGQEHAEPLLQEGANCTNGSK